LIVVLLNFPLQIREQKILFQPILRTLSEVFEQLRFYVEHNFPESQVDNQELHRLVTVLEEVLHNVRLVE
jgi:hypothetical protein